MDGQISIFESIGGSGVHLLDWKSFRLNNWHLLYNKVVLRRLNFNRTHFLLQKLNSFIEVIFLADLTVKSTVGKSYQFVSLPFTEKKGFFCSELIARLYLQLGLTKKTDLDPEKIYPSNFCGKAVDDLLVPTLSFEYQILFEELS